MGKPYQFVGYWSQAASVESCPLDAILDRVSHSSETRLLKKSAHWAIAYLGADSRLPRETAIALSACGRVNHRDVWVEVNLDLAPVSIRGCKAAERL